MEIHGTTILAVLGEEGVAMIPIWENSRGHRLG